MSKNEKILGLILSISLVLVAVPCLILDAKSRGESTSDERLTYDLDDSSHPRIATQNTYKPVVIVTSPKDGDTVEGCVWINGTAYSTNPNTTIQKVEIKIGIRAWETVNGTTNWSYLWDTTQITDAEWSPTGNYTILVRAWDGYSYSEYYDLTVHVCFYGNIYTTPFDRVMVGTVFLGVGLIIATIVLALRDISRPREKHHKRGVMDERKYLKTKEKIKKCRRKEYFEKLFGVFCLMNAFIYFFLIGISCAFPFGLGLLLLYLGSRAKEKAGKLEIELKDYDKQRESDNSKPQ